MGVKTHRQRHPTPSHAGLTLSLFSLIVLPSLLGAIHPTALLVIPALFLVLLARLLLHDSSAEVWLVRALMVWALVRFAAVERLPSSAELMVQGFGAVAMVGLAGVLFGRVVAPGAVDAQRLYVATSTYLVTGFAFATVYQVIARLHPGAFRGLPDGGQVLSQALVYFGFMTLTTVGYGDITPQTPLTRALATLEAAGGQLYLAILVGRLIGLHLGQGPKAASLGEDSDS